MKKLLFISHEGSRTGAPFVLLNLLKGLKNSSNIQYGINGQVGVGTVVDVYDRLAVFCVYDAYNNKWFCRDTRQS